MNLRIALKILKADNAGERRHTRFQVHKAVERVMKCESEKDEVREYEAFAAMMRKFKVQP